MFLMSEVPLRFSSPGVGKCGLVIHPSAFRAAPPGAGTTGETACSIHTAPFGVRSMQSIMLKCSSWMHIIRFFFFFTLVTGPRRSLSLKLSDAKVYEPQIRARLVIIAHFIAPLGRCAGERRLQVVHQGERGR